MDNQADDQARQLAYAQQHPHLHPYPQQPKSTGSLMDYVRNNKLAVAIVILILIGLIWWFCFRKSTTNITTNVTGTPATVAAANNVPKVQVNRMRNAF